MATLEELKTLLRRKLGNISTSYLSDEQAGDAVNSALREYSKYKPIQVLDYIVTVKDQALYDLSSKTGIIRVKEVFYSTGPFEYFDEFWPDYSQLGRLHGISIFEHPSVWTQFLQKVEQFKNIFNGEFEYEKATKMLRLIPAPNSTGSKVYYIWTKIHSASTIPEDDIDVLLLWAMAESKEMVASKRSNEIRSVSGYGESVTIGSAPETLYSEAKDLKEKFHKRFGGSYLLVG